MACCGTVIRRKIQAGGGSTSVYRYSRTSANGTSRKPTPNCCPGNFSTKTLHFLPPVSGHL